MLIASLLVFISLMILGLKLFYGLNAVLFLASLTIALFTFLHLYDKVPNNDANDET